MSDYTLTQSEKIHLYATHQAMLARCVVETSGPVMELGTGLYSTPILHAICMGLGRDLVSIDDNAEWLKTSRRHARYDRNPRHQWRHVTGGWQSMAIESPRAFGIDADRWSVVLVDQTPIPARALSVTRLRGCADLIVCHDSEHRIYGYEPVLAPFQFRAERQRGAPWTTVVSDTMDLAFLESLL